MGETGEKSERREEMGRGEETGKKAEREQREREGQDEGGVNNGVRVGWTDVDARGILKLACRKKGDFTTRLDCIQRFVRAQRLAKHRERFLRNKKKKKTYMNPQ